MVISLRMVEERYSRQVLFSGIGEKGQDLIRSARVLIVGCGALGASHSEMLARAGIGFMRIVDRDFVELSNLQRQTLFTEEDAATHRPKAFAAKKRISEINSSVEIDDVVADMNHTNAETLISDVDLAIDGSDNFLVRYLVNDVCVKLGIPWVYGAAVSSYGTTMTIRPGDTPCLRCIFSEMPAPGSSPTCETAGVIQPVISAVSSIQVSEVLKLVTGLTSKLHNSLLQIDVWENDWRRIRLAEPDPLCPACAKHEFRFLDADAQENLTLLCGRNAVQITPATPARLDLVEMSEKLRSFHPESNEFLIRFDVEKITISLFRDARAIIQGTEDISEARAMYAKYVGS